VSLGETREFDSSEDVIHLGSNASGLLLCGTESFVFQFAIQKDKDQDI